MTTLGTLKLWQLLTGGRYSEVVVSSGLTVFSLSHFLFEVIGYIGLAKILF
jgi:hypothetical protein